MITKSPYFSLRRHNTFGMEQCCKLFVEYDTKEDLIEFIKGGGLKGERFMALGGGSNVLLMEDYDGVMLHSRISGIEVVKEEEESVYVKAGSGVVWDDFVRYAAEELKAWGAENLSYIPGTVGASVVQNIGAYGAEAKDIAIEIEMVSTEDGETKTAKAEECEFGYRMSRFKKDWAGKYIVTAVTYRLSKTAKTNLSYGGLGKRMDGKELTTANIRAEVIAMRKEKLPETSEYGSAGSFFKNPVVTKADYDKACEALEEGETMPKYDLEDGMVKIPAAWLIEHTGWKGQSRGDAGVWAKQPLVLINYGMADGQDIADLAKQIQGDVWNKYGVALWPEVIYVK